jgi:hypothetical protein
MVPQLAQTIKLTQLLHLKLVRAENIHKVPFSWILASLASFRISHGEICYLKLTSKIKYSIINLFQWR